MALVTRVSAASVDTSTALTSQQIAGLIAGEDIDVAAPCYIKASDGKVYMSNGTAANEAAKVHGWNPRPNVKAGQPVTLMTTPIRFRYGTGLTPGARYYVGATAGRLDTAATTGDGIGVAFALNATDIMTLPAQPAAGVLDPGAASVAVIASQTIDSATPANVTGLALAGLAAGTYDVEAWVSFLSADAGVGLEIGATVSAGFVAMSLQVSIPGATAEQIGSIVASGGVVTAPDAGAAVAVARVRGFLTINATATLQIQAARETDTGDHDIAINPSRLIVRKIA